MNRLEAAQRSEAGQLIRRALDLLALVKLGLQISLDEIQADELMAMLVIEEERDRREEEKASKT